jgi:hypothetical protein
MLTAKGKRTKFQKFRASSIDLRLESSKIFPVDTVALSKINSQRSPGARAVQYFATSDVLGGREKRAKYSGHNDDLMDLANQLPTSPLSNRGSIDFPF